MIKFFRFSFLVWCIWYGSTGCKNSSDPKTAPTAATTEKTAPTNLRKNIVFFGNSLTAAFGLPPEKGYVALIQKKIDSLQLNFTCVNAGLSGETTADGKNRVDWVLQQPTDVFVLELGGNDALRGLPIDASSKNLASILEKVKAKYPNCICIITGMEAPPNLGPTYTKAFRRMFVDLARNFEATLIPFLLEGVGGDPALNLEDGIHPNQKGQIIVAENVWQVLEPIIRTGQ